MGNKPEKENTIKLNPDKLFGRHWIGEAQVAASATKIGDKSPATKIGVKSDKQ